MTPRTHSARLHALAAALCALLLLVALGLLDATHAPWWALLSTQGALLVTTASAGIWLDRADDERRRAAVVRKGPDDPLWWARLERQQLARLRRLGAGEYGPGDDDDVFWQERRSGGGKEER